MLGDVAKRLRGRAGFDDDDLSVAVAREARREGAGRRGAGAGRRARGAAARGEGRAGGGLDARRRGAGHGGVSSRSASAGWRAGPSARWPSTSSASWRTPGAEGPSFPPIVASGAHGALPHAVPRDVEIPRDTLVVIDMGAIVDGYCSDCTRTFATGTLRRRRARGLRARAARPGARRSPPRGPAPTAARSTRSRASIIDAAGHEEHFGHGLGHGVGLEVHEAPRLGKTAEGSLVDGERGDGRAGRVPAGRRRRADRGPRDRHGRRAARS